MCTCDETAFCVTYVSSTIEQQHRLYRLVGGISIVSSPRSEPFARLDYYTRIWMYNGGVGEEAEAERERERERERVRVKTALSILFPSWSDHVLWLVLSLEKVSV